MSARLEAHVTRGTWHTSACQFHYSRYVVGGHYDILLKEPRFSTSTLYIFDIMTAAEQVFDVAELREIIICQVDAHQVSDEDTMALHTVCISGAA